MYSQRECGDTQHLHERVRPQVDLHRRAHQRSQHAQAAADGFRA